MTLRRKLTWFITVLVIGLIEANLIVIRHEYSQTLLKNFDERMTTIGTSVGLMVLPSLVATGGNIDDRLAEVDALLRRTVADQNDIAQIVVFDGTMKPLQSYSNPGIIINPDRVREKIIPIRISREGAPYGFVKVTFDLGAYEEDQQRVLLSLMELGGVFAIIGLIASLFMTRTITRPLEKLRDGAVEFGNKNYDARVQVESTDEIGLLADTFNDMAANIDKQIRRIHRLQEWSREVAGKLDMARVVDAVVRAFGDLGGVSKMSLMILNESTAQLEIVGGIGLKPEVEGFLKLKSGEGIAGKVLESGKIMRVKNLSDCAEYKSFSGDPGMRGSLIAFPLVANSKCFGVINLHEKIDGSSFDESDESILTTLAEISSVAFENARLYDMAITDGLTRLFIARYFHQRMGEEITRTHRTARPLSLLMMDIDHFKDVNDTYGHQAGDSVLVAIAKIVRRIFREVDIPCRYGGEEFVVILPDTDMPGSLIVAERFRAAVEAFLFSNVTGELRVTISVGISTYTLGKTKDELIHEADSALYSSKRKGRNATTHFAHIA